MKHHQLIRFLPLLFLASSLTSQAQPPQAGSASITPLLGSSQPLAPGYHSTTDLPRIELTKATPSEKELLKQKGSIEKIEYTSNGKIEAAHAIFLIEDGTPFADQLTLAQTIARLVFAERPSLAELCISIYQRQGYQGFGGPPPQLTASIPKNRLGHFLKLTAQSPINIKYDRLWINPGYEEPSAVIRHAQLPDRAERAIVFSGTEQAYRNELKERLISQMPNYGGTTADKQLFYGNSIKKLAALTFDDAPHPIYATLLLDILHREKIRATFFCIGRNSFAYPYYLRDIAEEGHEIGNHTYHHARLTKLPVKEQARELAIVESEIELAENVFRNILKDHINAAVKQGKKSPLTNYFRPPGGDYSEAILKKVGELGYITVFWTDDPGDFNNPEEKVLTKRLVRYLRPGGIILLHDNVKASIDTLPDFIKAAKAEKTGLVPVSELATPVEAY